MQTAIRLKQKVTSEKLVLSFSELKKLIGREIEIIILVDGEIEDSSVPPKALQNSSHVAGSVILDKEAMQQLMDSRFK
jgi:pentose-5-phosphate-3-epimerase